MKPAKSVCTLALSFMSKDKRRRKSIDFIVRKLFSAGSITSAILILLLGCSRITCFAHEITNASDRTSLLNDKEVNFRLNLKEGSIYRCSNRLRQLPRLEFQGKNALYSFDIRTDYTFTTKRVDKAAGTMDVELTYDRIIATREGLGTREEYDTSNPGLTIPKFSWKHDVVTGKTIKLRYTREGKIIKIDSPEIIRREFQQRFGQSSDFGDLLRDFDETYGEVALIKEFEFTLPPQSSVTPGFVWNEVDESSSGLPLKSETGYVVTSASEGSVVLNFTISISSIPNSPYETGGVTFHHDVRGLGNGTMEYETGSGMLRRIDRKEFASGDLSLKASDSSIGVAVSFPFSYEGSLAFRAECISSGKD